MYFPTQEDILHLEKGDKVKIGTFEAGTSIGFVLQGGPGIQLQIH